MSYRTLYYNSCSSDEDLKLAPRQSFGQRFLLLEALGSGGFGQVWRAKDRLLGQVIALKISQQDLKNETLQLRRLPKDRYVNIFDYLRDDGLGASAYSMEVLEPPWMTLEDYQTSDLFTRLEKRDNFDALKAALCISIDILHSLHILHGRKYGKTNRWCHGDIKPLNIFVDSKAISKLIDHHIWGSDFSPVTKIGDLGLTRRTGSELRAGTQFYMAPEHSDSSKKGAVTAATDIFAIGQTIVKLVCGEPLDPDADELIHRKRIKERLQMNIPSAHLLEKVTEIVRLMTMTTPSIRPYADKSIALLKGVVDSEEDWAIFSVFGGRSQLKLEEASENLFHLLASSRRWNNLTVERLNEMKRKIRQAYLRKLLSLDGHRYSIRV